VDDYSKFIDEPRPAIRAWARAREGKAAVIGTLVFALGTAGYGMLGFWLTPTEFSAPEINYVIGHDLRVPCKAKGRRYLYGFPVAGNYGDGRYLDGILCRNLGGAWVLEYHPV